MKTRIILITFLSIILISGYSRAQGGVAAVSFLELPASAEMFGMGYTSVALRSGDPMTPAFNPAHLGMQSFNNNLSVGYNSSDWLSPYWPGLKATSFAVNGGVDLQKFIKQIPSISVGFGYSRIKMDYGKFLQTDPDSPNIVGAFDSYDKTDNFTVSAAIDYYVKASFGFTFKHVTSDMGRSAIVNGLKKELSATADLYDWGMLIEAPVFPILERTVLSQPVKINNFSPVLDLTFGFSNSNLGQSSIYYVSSAMADPLPRMARAGIGALAGIQYNINDVSFMPVTAKWTIEANDVLVKGRNVPDAYLWDYQSGFGDINFFKEVILGKTNDQTQKLKGWELNLLETVSLYGGRFEESREMGDRRFNSNGWSIRTAGLFKVIKVLSPNLFGNNIISYVLNNLDFRYSTSQIETDNPNSALNNVKFSSFNVIFSGF